MSVDLVSGDFASTNPVTGCHRLWWTAKSPRISGWFTMISMMVSGSPVDQLVESGRDVCWASQLRGAPPIRSFHSCGAIEKHLSRGSRDITRGLTDCHPKLTTTMPRQELPDHPADGDIRTILRDLAPPWMTLPGQGPHKGPTGMVKPAIPRLFVQAVQNLGNMVSVCLSPLICVGCHLNQPGKVPRLHVWYVHFTSFYR